jgi:hypothetical protein
MIKRNKTLECMRGEASKTKLAGFSVGITDGSDL